MKERRPKEGNDMIKIYGMPTCPYCDYIRAEERAAEKASRFIVENNLL